MRRMIQNSWIIIRHDQIRVDSFSSFFFFIRFRNDAEIFRTRFNFVVKMQIFWNNHEFAIHLKTSFKTFRKKIIRQIQHFNRFDRFNLKNEHRKSKKIYFVTILFQFIFCASIWFVFNEKHDYKQKKNTIFIFMKNIQTKTAKIISKNFRNITKTALNIEFHLLSIQNQMNIVFYDAMLKIIISSIYSYIKIQRILSNRQLLFEQIQHQKNFYVQFNFFHKLKTRYATIFKKNLNRLKIKKTIKIHDAIKIQKTSLIIYTNDSDIEKNVKTSTMTIFILIDDQISIVIDKKRIYLKFFIEHTVYSNKLINLNLTLNIVKIYFENTMINIFINNQTIIKIIKFFKQQSNQYIFRALTQKINNHEIFFHIHWISTHIKIFDNETANEIVKKTTKWKFSKANNRISTMSNSRIFIAAIRNEICIWANEIWIDKWKIEIIEKTIHWLIKISIKKILKKFKQMTRSKNSMIVQIKTNKIKLKNYFFKIDVANFPKYPCEAKKQTMQHTLLECFKFDDFKKKCD